MNPHMKNQSMIINQEKQIHASVLEYSDDFEKDIHTLKDLLDKSFTIYADYPCLTIREDFHEESQTCTYEETKQNVLNMGSGLQILLNYPKDTVFVGIYARNSPKWLYTFLSCVYYDFVAVPMDNTLGEEALSYMARRSELSAIVCETMTQAQRIIREQISTLSAVIVIRNELDADIWNQVKQKLPEKLKLERFSDVIELGAKNPIVQKEAKTDDLVQICYTSGSTGPPKGVIHTQKSFRESISLVRSVLYQMGKNLEKMVHLSYMPLSHMLELGTSIGSLTYGIQISYMTKGYDELMKDFLHYRPHVFCTVPRMLSRIHLETMGRVNENRILRWCMQWVIGSKIREQSNGILSKMGIMDRIFLKPIRDTFGGRIEFILYGGAPLFEDVRDFVRAAFSCELLEVYGSTEAGGVATMVLPLDPDPNHVGALIHGIEAYLADLPLMGIQAAVDGMGEVCIRSPANTPGYHKDEEKTRELYTEDGFLRTGDIGKWTETGALKIVDRCKSIFKLALGEFVAPEKVEQCLRCCNLIENIMVDGYSAFNFAVAVATLNFEEVSKCFSDIIGENGADLSEVCQNTVIADNILEHLTLIGKARGLLDYELPKKIYLSHEPFTIENGLLTSTMKLARSRARQHFASQIKELYASRE